MTFSANRPVIHRLVMAAAHGRWPPITSRVGLVAGGSRIDCGLQMAAQLAIEKLANDDADRKVHCRSGKRRPSTTFADLLEHISGKLLHVKYGSQPYHHQMMDALDSGSIHHDVPCSKDLISRDVQR